jgi:hypothetical protein
MSSSILRALASISCVLDRHDSAVRRLLSACLPLTVQIVLSCLVLSCLVLSCLAQNDGFGGGDNITENVLFHTCRESSDHGPINSWDRQVRKNRSSFSHLLYTIQYK